MFIEPKNFYPQMQNIEYLLKYTLDSSLLILENMKDISDINMISSFKKKFNDTKTLKLFTNDGFTFPIFNIPLQKGIKHKVMYCEVAVGESLFVTKEYAKTLHTPDKFNSFIINEKNDQFDLLINNEEFDIKNFSYIIKDQNRVLPLYEVTFEYDEELERKSKGVFICERCKIYQSVSFCPSERANFCEKCDEEVHCDEFHKRHDRYYFNKVGKKRFIYCLIHPETMVEYFCMDCIIPICTKCKISGNHSELPNSSHGLIRYLEACDKLTKSVKESNNGLQPSMEKIANSIERFKKECFEWKNKISNVRQKIEAQYKSILNELKVFENGQFQIINAHFIEHATNLYSIERMKNYSISLESSQLVRNYKNIMDQRSKILIDKNIDYVPKNIELKGKLMLGDSIQLIPRTGFSPRMEKTTKMYVETRGSLINKDENEEIQ